MVLRLLRVAVKRMTQKENPMAKTRPARTQAERNKRQGNRCWKGYEPTPGKKPGTKGSCKLKSK